MRYFKNFEKKHFTPEELKQLVEAAQKQDAKAIEALCASYEGLIRKLSNNSRVRAYYEYEDAVNSCYVFFLELILSYKGSHYDKLPGLIELYVTGRLHRLLFYESRYSGQTSSLDAFSEQGSDILIAPSKPTDNLATLMAKEFLAMYEPLDRRILMLYYVEDLSVRAIAEELNLTFTQVRYRLHLAKKLFKKY